MPIDDWGGAIACRTDGLYGPWVMIRPERLLERKNKVGSGQCVAIAQPLLNMPITSLWREGEKVLGNNSIARGTVIATFINGLYPSLPHGNHVAIYISQTANTIKVVEQWSSLKKPQERDIPIKEGMNDRSNNANAFSVVYTLPGKR